MLAKPAPRDSKQAHASVSLAPVSSLLTPLRYAWLVVALLWLVALLNYFDRLLITTMRDPIKVDIAMTDAQFGLLTSIFLWVYAAFSPLGGLLADRLGRKRVIVVSLLFWSAAPSSNSSWPGV
jgi:MFS family permease